MLSRLFDRSVRCLTACLAVVALVTALAVPVQAAPRGESEEPASSVRLVERFENWVQAWVVILYPTRSSTEKDEEQAFSSKNGTCIDPDGNPVSCPEND
jgi:hypothetical protein